LTRSEVRGGGKKPWKQKGTGRARAGTIRSPLWRGGAVLFGPKPRDYSYALPKKVRMLAIKMALSGKVKDGKIKVIDKMEVADGKTKNMAIFLKTLEVSKILFSIDDASENLKRAFSNIPGSKMIKSKDLNILDILKYNWIVFDKAAVANTEERFRKKHAKR
jgi:large subunit ribosomal protein L4